MDETMELIAEAQITNPKMNLLGVINFAFPAGKDNEDVLNMLHEDHPDLPIHENVIVQRKIWSDLSGEGLALTDRPKKDPKATAEFASLLNRLNIS